ARRGRPETHPRPNGARSESEGGGREHRGPDDQRAQEDRGGPRGAPHADRVGGGGAGPGPGGRAASPPGPDAPSDVPLGITIPRPAKTELHSFHCHPVIGMVSPRRALFSVSDKEGLVDFARGLRALGFELMGTEGTAKTLKDAGLPVTTVADYTGLHEGLGGRVKTLHPKIFAGILAPRGDERDLADLGAVPIDLVVVNLYPFETTA